MSIQPGVGYTFTSSSQGTNLNIEQAWQPLPLYPTVEDAPFVCSPFKVHDVYEVTDGSTYYTYEICPGTFNNLMPQVYDEVNEVWSYLDALATDAELVLDFGSSTSSLIYLRVGPDAGTNDFPPTSPGSATDDPYPRIYSTGTALPADTDEFGYVLLAKVTNTSGVFSIDQYVTGSLWGDRIKIGTTTARYYYARI